MPTDPMFSRYVTRDTEFFGTHIPQGSVLHLCLGAANRDPARWERPDEYDIDATAEALARVRQRSARVPRHARRPRRDVRRDQRAARPAPEPAPRPRRRTAPLHRHVRTRRDGDPGGRSAQEHDERTRLQGTRHHAARRGAHPPLPRDRRRGRLPLERRRRRSSSPRPVDAAASHVRRPLIFARDGDDYLVVASMGGAPQHPTWYLNLHREPEGRDPGEGRRHPGDRAHRLRRREAAPLARSSTRSGRTTTCTRSRTERAIPVVVLSPVVSSATDRRCRGPSVPPTGRPRCNAPAPGRSSRRKPIVDAARRLIVERGNRSPPRNS